MLILISHVQLCYQLVLFQICYIYLKFNQILTKNPVNAFSLHYSNDFLYYYLFFLVKFLQYQPIYYHWLKNAKIKSIFLHLKVKLYLFLDLKESDVLNTGNWNNPIKFNGSLNPKSYQTVKKKISKVKKWTNNY